MTFTRSRKAGAGACWSCGRFATRDSRGYCADCVLRGLDSPLITCKAPGCNMTKKRVIPGQQAFDCPQHSSHSVILPTGETMQTRGGER